MGLHHHRWTWSEPIGLPGQQIAWCQGCGLRRPPDPPRERGFAHDQSCRDALRQRDAMRVVLHRMREYAAHSSTCDYEPTYPETGDTDPCTCGFDQVLDDYDRWAAL